MTNELKVGDIVLLKADVCSFNTTDVAEYQITAIFNLPVYGCEYKLNRVSDGQKLEHLFQRNEIIPVPYKSLVTVSGDCCMEAPSPYHDKHYNGCIIEPILLMQQHLTSEQFEGFLLGNIIKYRVRAGHKEDAKKDIDKAMRYEQWLREFQEHGTITL